MSLIVHEIVKRDAVFGAIRLDHDVRNLGHMAHFRRAMKACIVLTLAEFEDGLDILRLSHHKIITLQVQLRFHAYSSGTTLTTPAAVS